MIEGAHLQTARLIVRPFEPSDADALVSLFEDPDVRRFVGTGEALTRPDADLWITRSRENLARFGYGTGAVTRIGEPALIGWAGFARPGDGGEEIIYGFASHGWGQGYGSELLRALIAFANDRAMPEVRATVDPAKVASIQLLSGAGFRLANPALHGDPSSALYVLSC